MSSVAWLLFDVGGVLSLADDERWPGEFAARTAARLGLTIEDYRARVGAAVLPDPRTQQGVEPAYWRALGAALGADTEVVEAVRADFWDAYCGEPNTDLLAFVRRQHGRVGLAILSNSGDGAREQEEARFAFSQMFDPICYSHEIGVGKPDPAAYRAALAAMGTSPERVVFVDNLRVNVDAAAALGMRTVLHTDNATTIAALEALLAGA